ncbi:hypothetical protein Tco_1168010 [Tanacetum coccineum]
MASTRASISKVSKRPKINIIPPKQLFVDLTQDDTKTPSPKLLNSSPSAPNAPSKTPSTKDTSSSSIDYIPKSPTSSTSPSPNGYLNPSTSPPPRVSPPPPTQDNASMDITLTLSPNTLLDVQFDTPSPLPPIIAHPIPWNFLEAHEVEKKSLKVLQEVVKCEEVVNCEVREQVVKLSWKSLQKINTLVVIWRNKHDLDTMSFDDLYNNFQIIEQEVKGIASSSSSSSSHNLDFMSSNSSTNEVNTAYGVSTVNTQVSTDITQVSIANLSDATVYAFLANQPNGYQLVHEDLEQIHKDNLEEIDLKWQLALLSMRTRKFF